MTTTFLLAPADRFNAYINFDFGRNSSPTGVTSTWKGIAGAAKFRFNDRFALTPLRRSPKVTHLYSPKVIQAF
jgi:hypothetical protein